MKKPKNVLISLLLMMFISCGYSQIFPPPGNLLVIVDGDVPILSWDSPSKDLVYYNIYRNNLFIDSTTDLEYTDTIQFFYFNEWYVTAVYTNPDGESEPSNWTVLSILLLEEIPYFENFDFAYAIWSTKAITGQTEWELVDTTSYSGNQSAGCYSSSYGDKSVLYSCPISGYAFVEIQLKFWYKCPIENYISDELRVYKIDWPADTIYLANVLSDQNQWTEKVINLGDLEGLQLYFESTSKGGGGVFIDSISVTEILTATDEIMKFGKIQLYQNTPNPFDTKTTIGFYLPNDGKINLSVYNINGQLLDIVLDEKLQSGEHFIDFYPLKLSAGIYYYSVETNDEKLVKKLIIK